MSVGRSKDGIGKILLEIQNQIGAMANTVPTGGIDRPTDERTRISYYHEGYKDALLDIQSIIRRRQ